MYKVVKYEPSLTPEVVFTGTYDECVDWSNEHWTNDKNLYYWIFQMSQDHNIY